MSPVAELMIEADQGRRASDGRHKHAVERDLKAAVRATLESVATARGLRLHPTELPITPAEWPRVGAVDVVLSDGGASPSGPATAFVELKWARVDKLWHCAWDLAKAALVSRLRLATRSLLLVGASATETSSRYGGLVTESDRATPDFLRRYHDALRPFCTRDDGFAHPRGPYQLPAAFQTRYLCAPHRFRLRNESWTLFALEVVASDDRDWVHVDERGLPA